MIGNKTGKLGEDLAERFLKTKGFEILHKNYWKPYGEIDIVAKKGDKLHFVEVKSVSCEINNDSCLPVSSSERSRSGENMRPEDNVHKDKLKKLGQVIEVFLNQYQYKAIKWQFDVVVLYIDQETKKANVRVLENEVLPELRK